MTFKKLFIVCVMGGVLKIISHGPFANSVSYSEDYDFYSISPVSTSDISDQVFLTSPILINGTRYAGLTSWSSDFNYSILDNGNNYSVNKLGIALDVTYTMPKLALFCCSDNIETRFNTFYEHLDLHEHGHGQILDDAKYEIFNYLMDTPAQNSKQALKKALKTRFDEVIQTFSDLSNQYDVDTRHGYTQGANI